MGIFGTGYTVNERAQNKEKEIILNKYENSDNLF